MTVATRASFTGSSPDALPRGLVVALTSAPDGGWTQVIGPHAVEHSGVLYFGFVDGDDGHVKVGSWDGTTTTLFTLGTAPEVDTHDAPIILIRASDSRLMAFWSGHGGPTVLLRISTSPLDVTAWGAEVSLDAQLGGSLYTYPSVVQLTGEANDPIYLFYRASDAVMAYSTSADGGSTWAAQTVLAQQSGDIPYFVIDSDGDTRIDVAISSGHPINDGDASTHHLYWEGGWKETDGSALGAPPFTVTDLPLVDAGNGWPHAIISDGLTIGYTVDEATTTYHVATWNGSTWDKVELADAGALVADAEPTAMALADADTAYASVKASGVYELRRFDRDTGWTIVPVTDGSAASNIYPARIHGGTNRKFVWLRGSYASYLDNSLCVMAGR